jgi:pimeloyl-ACP methyl ester carboxylesterase
MAHHILVHGAWHGAWCWAKVVPHLERAGHTAVALDLPGLGDDRTPPQATSLASYAERVVAALDAADGPSVLSGHSMGGMVISLAAEARPEKVRALMYVCAFLPRDGDSLFQLAAGDEDARVQGNAVVDEAQGLMAVEPSKRREVFYGDCTDEDASSSSARLVPQFMGVLATPVRLTAERHGSVRREYIECLQDRAISIARQRQMVAASPCAAVHTLDASHSPFLSQPEALAALLAAAG